MPRNANGPKRPDTIYEPRIKKNADGGDDLGVENLDFIVLRIGTGKKSLKKYEIVLEIPNVQKCLDEGMTLDEFFAQDFFSGRGLDPQTAIIQLARKLGTAPQFETYVDREAEPTLTDDPTNPDHPFIDYPLVEDGHKKMQELMDNYEIGRQPSESAVAKAEVKRKAKAMDNLEAAMAEKGWTMEQIQAVIAKKAPKS